MLTPGLQAMLPMVSDTARQLESAAKPFNQMDTTGKVLLAFFILAVALCAVCANIGVRSSNEEDDNSEHQQRSFV